VASRRSCGDVVARKISEIASQQIPRVRFLEILPCLVGGFRVEVATDLKKGQKLSYLEYPEVGKSRMPQTKGGW